MFEPKNKIYNIKYKIMIIFIIIFYFIYKKTKKFKK